MSPRSSTRHRAYSGIYLPQVIAFPTVCLLKESSLLMEDYSVDTQWKNFSCVLIKFEILVKTN